MADERRAIHAYLTVESHEVWHRVAESEGMSVSSLLETLARDMDANPPAEGGLPRWPEIVRTARGIDAQRRRRGTTAA